MKLYVVRYFPDWFPGTGWKQTAKQWGAELRAVTEQPYAFVKHQLARGSSDKSFLSRLLEAGDDDAEEKFTNKWSAMSLYTAGADTVRQEGVTQSLSQTPLPHTLTPPSPCFLSDGDAKTKKK
jgi:hypothetical protein